MSQIWTFSPSSEIQLQKCIAAALPPDENNKWVQKFFRKLDENSTTHNLTEQQHERLNISENTPETDSQDNYKEFIEIIENESILRFEDIEEECCKNRNLLVYLAEQLSSPSVEKFCKQLHSKTTSDVFLTNVYTKFIPTIIKREYNRYIIDFLVLSRENRKGYLEILIDIVIRDTAISRNVLNDYILTLNKQERVEFMKRILDMDLSAECFAYNIPVVYNIYKECSKSHDVQCKMLPKLLEYGLHCKNDRHYGKMLLAFLQTEQSIDKKANEKAIKQVVEKHRSAFRRPCEIILNKIIDNMN